MLYWTLSPIYFDPTGTPPLEKLYSVFLFTADLSLREMKERKKREEPRRVGNYNCSNA
jgi:hypothetical protein